MKVGLHCDLKNLALEITLILRFYEFLLLSAWGRFTSSSQEVRCLSETMGNVRPLILRRVPESWWRWEWNEMSLTINRVLPSCSAWVRVTHSPDRRDACAMQSLCAWSLVSDDSEARSVRTRNAGTFSLMSALSWSAPSRIKRWTHFCPNYLPPPITKQLCFSKHPIRVHNKLLRKENEKRSLTILWTKIDGDAIESAFPSSLCLSVFSFYSTMLLCIKLLIKWI